MKILKIFVTTLLIVFMLGTALLWISSHAQHQRDDDLFSCSAQAIDKVTAEQARTTKVYEQVERAAIISIDVDACMSRKGYKYTGGQDLEYCNGKRLPHCYSGHVSGNLPTLF